MKNLLPLVLLSLLVASCNLTPEGFWSGDSNVNHRYAGLKNLCDEDPELALWASEEACCYQVLLITDVHVGAGFYRTSAEKAFFDWLENYPQKSQLRFALGLGDFANSARESEFIHYAEIAAKIREQGIRVFNVIGNHDLYADDGFELYEKYCEPGASFYKFETAKLAWYGLDTASGSLGSRQLAGLRAELSLQQKRPVIFTHMPLVMEGKDFGIVPFCLHDTTERNILIGLFCEAGSTGYFCGHFHPGGRSSYGSLTQFNLKSFGEYGKWYVLKVCETESPPSFELVEFGE